MSNQKMFACLQCCCSIFGQR